MLDRLQTMKVFLGVVDEGGFSAAARSLSMTVSNVTRHVAALEEHLGTRLLQRTTRRVSLTPAGERYAARARDILESVDDAFADVQGTTSALIGVLRIVAAPMFTDSLIAPLVAPFRLAYPGISLEVHVDSNPLPDLGKYDLAFLHAHEGFDAHIVARTLATSEAYLCASPAYIARHGQPRTPAALRDHQCLLRRATPSHRDVLALWHSGERVTVPPVHEIAVTPVVTINETASLMQMVLDGAGIATFTDDIAAPFIRDGALLRVLPGWITGRYAVLAALPSRKHMPERTRVFLEFVSGFQQQILADHGA